MKRYIKPEMEIVDIVTDNILAAFSTSNSLPENDDPDNNFAKDNTFNLWDTDEDE
ncbi:MAG: toxin PIN [Prevotella sp.]